MEMCTPGWSTHFLKVSLAILHSLLILLIHCRHFFYWTDNQHYRYYTASSCYQKPVNGEKMLQF